MSFVGFRLFFCVLLFCLKKVNTFIDNSVDSKSSDTKLLVQCSHKYKLLYVFKLMPFNVHKNAVCNQ